MIYELSENWNILFPSTVFCCLTVSTVEEVSQMVRDSIDFMDDPVNAQTTCNAETLMCTVSNATKTLVRVDDSMKNYIDNEGVNKYCFLITNLFIV